MGNGISSVKASVLSSSASVGSNEINKKKAYIDKLPPELERLIFSYLKPSDLGNISAVDKRRNKVVSTPDEKTPSLKDKAVHRDFAFNSKDWKIYCNKDVDTEGEMSFFPKNIWKKLNEPCPAFPGKLVGQTHVITWMPKTMNEESLTLNSFRRVLKDHFPKNNNGYRYIWAPIAAEHGETGTLKSYWAFMTRDVIPRSRGKPYTVQEGLVTNLDRGSYKVPKAVEAVVCISTKYFKTGERLFNDAPWTYTRCQEQAQGYQVVVGGFAAAGLRVYNDDCSGYDYGDSGVAARWKSGP